MDRHKEFQLGTNPMEMTPFEKSCKLKEEIERHQAKVEYTMGLQGVDGGKCMYKREDIDHFPPLKN